MNTIEKKSELISAWDGYIRMWYLANQVVVNVSGVEIARSRGTIKFEEGARATVIYIPLTDVNQDYLVDSDLHTRCKWKGVASYKHFFHADRTIENILWIYPDPFYEVSVIHDCVSFDLEKAEVLIF